jgi:prophage regulatory protein
MSTVLPRVITRKELRQIVPYTPQHILRLEKQGKFPPRIHIGDRRVGWYLADIETWLANRLRGGSLHAAHDDQGERPVVRSQAQPR